MYRVIDTIVFRDAWLRHHPKLAERGEGILALLDPKQIREPPALQGRKITILKPDGRSAELIVDEVMLGAGSVVGLFFKGAPEDTIMRGSVIQW